METMMNQRSFAEIAEILRELGIEGITDEWEAGTGKRSITFDWKGNTYTLEAENNQDWFDFQAAEGLNEIIAAEGGSKKLYFASDGYQECIVFYCDKDWAEKFQKKTGLELED